MHLPVIDIAPLVSRSNERRRVAAEIGAACREFGFFYVTGHEVDENLQTQLEDASRRFFAQDLEAKLEIRMQRGSRAWRGYFPVGGELTSGKADLKEGIYFGAELDANHPMVRARTPLHGANVFPAAVPQPRRLVLDYMAAMTRLGHSLMAGLSLSLGLEESYIDEYYTRDPLILC